ncbi:iron-containing alcohol dehydrogenase [Sulfitobacter sp.]|uniref:iron-containing alcohol dehydrogenase n=1 Tax=Sulfitobacter sp. TaxID=1903071 RepID=UPI003EF9695B
MFSFFSPQAIHFGRGQCQNTAALAATFGTSVLLVHGASVSRAQWLIDACHAAGLTIETISCANEPSLPDIERALHQLNGVAPDVVIGLGGGSVLDFAKAMAALTCCDGDPKTYLEVVGDGRPLDRAPLPMIALPTTAGTGAEVTKNAVILVPDQGIKVSLRDPQMVPNIAIVDPSLMQGAPKHVALAAGLDAVTQVIEPYLSIKANPMTDALCHAAISTGLGALRELVENDTPDAWDKMAWVSTCGGLALANSGLGAVHGFAGVIGGETNAPHGAICGVLLPAVLESHLRKTEDHTEVSVRLHWVLDQVDSYFAQGDTGAGITALRSWSQKMGLPGLEWLGLSAADHPKVAAAAAKASSMRGNPFSLSQHELLEILNSAK